MLLIVKRRLNGEYKHPLPRFTGSNTGSNTGSTPSLDGLTFVASCRENTGMRLRSLIPTIYIFLLMLPIYWLINMSFKTNTELSLIHI